MTIRMNADDVSDAAALICLWMREAHAAAPGSVVAFTGAGISTESGIPDFRSPGGVWAKNRTVYFDDFCRSAEERHEYWRQKSAAHADFIKARPNVTHTTLAALEHHGTLCGVITQNIDGLHAEAGNASVLELHGTARRVGCLDCDFNDDVYLWVEMFLADYVVPDCPTCGGRLKHATVSFGQSLPEHILQKSVEWSQQCRVFLALGSSLVVEPAASLPRMAAAAGAKLMILNRDQTPLDSHADLVVNASLGEVFTAIRDSM
jgi:NAD-dependent deacetylase